MRCLQPRVPSSWAIATKRLLRAGGEQNGRRSHGVVIGKENFEPSDQKIKSLSTEIGLMTGVIKDRRFSKDTLMSEIAESLLQTTMMGSDCQ